MSEGVRPFIRLPEFGESMSDEVEVPPVRDAVPVGDMRPIGPPFVGPLVNEVGILMSAMIFSYDTRPDTERCLWMSAHAERPSEIATAAPIAYSRMP